MNNAVGYEYEELLNRALERLPSKKGSSEVFEIPRAEVLIVGGRTIVHNFSEIAEVLGRERDVVQRYFVKELGVPAFTNEAGQLLLQGKFNASVINKLIEVFVEKYVKCPTCGAVHTRLAKKGKVFIMRCEACGAETTLPAF
ncbi:MAG: translation initiation factor IF-2 subunit beta [Thermosphaera sp.]